MNWLPVPRGVFFRALTASALCCCLSTGASAVLIDFDAGSFVDGPADSADEDVISKGFRFTDINAANPTAGVAENAQVNEVGGDNRLTVDQFGGAIVMTSLSGAPFDLYSFRLSNFTFNSGHTHQMQVEYNFDGGASELSPVFTVGTEIPGDRNLETADIVVDKLGLSSVVFSQLPIPNGPEFGRKTYLDDLVASPEPGAGALLLSAGLVGLARRRRDGER